MRSGVLVSATVFALASGVAAFAQPAFAQPAVAQPAFAQAVPNTPNGARPGNVPGTGNSLPTSNNASNIDRADTKSPIAPRLPAPGLAEGSSPVAFLTAAKMALRHNRTGEAQESLERAETRMLDRSTRQGADPLSMNPRVKQIRDARDALANGDRARAGQIIDMLISRSGA